jgi:hypothetical protein
MKARARVALSGLVLLLLAEGALAQSAPPAAVLEAERTWSFSAYGYAYLLPDEPDYFQPAFTADGGSLHLETRYNYEDRGTGSFWIGYNLAFGDKVTFELTPMAGAVVGRTSGVAPGLKTTVGWRRFELTSEAEYLFGAGSSADNFFFVWSELAWSPSDWLRVGLAAQRTRVYQTELDVQRGLLVGLTWRKASFTTYVFNPDGEKPTVVLGLGVDF